MKKMLIGSAITTLFILGAPMAASAWTYGLTGNGACQSDGSFKITWKVDNTSENQDLHITGSSYTTVVPAGTNVKANKTQNFTQTADGTKAGSYTLTLMGNWPSDQGVRTRSATVALDKACTQPVVVTTPPASTGTVLSEQAPAQVTAPVGAVNAGSGSRAISLSAMLGLLASVVVLGYGVVRVYKQHR